MPEHREGETKKQWMARCIPYVIKNEGLSPKHAVAKCSGMYEQHRKKAKAKQAPSKD